MNTNDPRLSASKFLTRTWSRDAPSQGMCLGSSDKIVRAKSFRLTRPEERYTRALAFMRATRARPHTSQTGQGPCRFVASFHIPEHNVESMRPDETGFRASGSKPRSVATAVQSLQRKSWTACPRRCRRLTAMTMRSQASAKAGRHTAWAGAETFPFVASGASSSLSGEPAGSGCTTEGWLSCVSGWPGQVASHPSRNQAKPTLSCPSEAHSLHAHQECRQVRFRASIAAIGHR